MTWFGSLDLAYKYAIIFGSLLALTIVAGAIKVLYDRNRINKAAKEEASLESGRREEQMELNQREKDEGDLFGIRAIEAGFYGGVSQSRPTSRAGSVAGTNTLVGSVASPKTGAHSAASSMSHLPLSDNLRSDSTKRKSPPSIKLRPSEAELNGRINHSGVVNMNLTVPPSPVHARGPQSPTFGGSDSGDSDGNASPRSLSPRSANFKPDHYAPVPPQIPMPSGIRVSVHSPEPMVKSQSASFNDQSPGQSPGNSAPPSPGMFPQTKLPSMPARAFRDEPRSLFPTQAERQPFLPEKSAARGAGIEQPQNDQTRRPSSPILLQPQAYQPNQPAHERSTSSASSTYSENRMSAYHAHKRSNSSGSSYNFSFPEHSSRNSISKSSSEEQNRRRSGSGSLNVPGGARNETRLSEFYDAYYRQSTLGVAQKADAPKRPNQLQLSQPTIVEVPSPMPSPNPHSIDRTGLAF